MKIFHYVVLSFLLALVAGCGAKPSNPQQQVFELEQNYELALSIAADYAALPDCTAGVTVCSTHDIRVKLKTAKDAAAPALQAAQNAVRDPNFNTSTSSAILIAAQQAVAALAAIEATLPVKKP